MGPAALPRGRPGDTSFLRGCSWPLPPALRGKNILFFSFQPKFRSFEVFRGALRRYPRPWGLGGRTPQGPGVAAPSVVPLMPARPAGLRSPILSLSLIFLLELFRNQSRGGSAGQRAFVRRRAGEGRSEFPAGGTREPGRCPRPAGVPWEPGAEFRRGPGLSPSEPAPVSLLELGGKAGGGPLLVAPPPPPRSRATGSLGAFARAVCAL